MEIKMVATFTLRRASQDACVHWGKPLGTYELLDPDGDRADWIEGSLSEVDARRVALNQIADILDSMGLTAAPLGGVE